MSFNLTHKKLLVFDFDGTIADTRTVAVKIVNELADEFGYRKVTEEEFPALKNKRLAELVKMSGLTWMQVPAVVKRARDQFRIHMPHVKPVDGMPDILKTFKEAGYRMGILTSNAQKTVQEFLKINELELFEFIHAPDSIFGKSKVLKEIKKQHKLKYKEIVMIGDEERDIEAAHKVGIDAVAVAWGLNSVDVLKGSKPLTLVHKPAELRGLFTEGKIK